MFTSVQATHSGTQRRPFYALGSDVICERRQSVYPASFGLGFEWRHSVDFVQLHLFIPVESQSVLSKFTLFQPLHPAVMFARLALLSLAVATASAAPTVPDTTQAPVDSCAGLGSGAFDTADNFTLAAFYTSLPNANATGLPLVLGSVAATDGAEYKALSTFGSFPYNQWTSLSLINGVLTGSGEDVPDAQAMSVPTGKALSFVTPPQGAAPQIFCAVADTDPAHGGFPQLAVNGDTDSFSLCPETTAPNALVNIVYNPDEGAQDYVFEQCTPVALHLVGLY